MTRVCMDCKTVLGEKCPSCGGSNLTLQRAFFARTYVCTDPDCSYLKKHARAREFVKGEGGETHGLCEDCRTKRHAAESVARQQK